MTPRLPPTEATLDELRTAIRAVDRDILERVEHRLRLAQAVGEEKTRSQLPIQDFKLEKQVVERARDTCRALGMDAAVGEEVMLPLIRHAVKAQERDRNRSRRGSRGKEILIIGGAGAMGRWFADFLADQGHVITILDPRGTVRGFAQATDLGTASLAAEVIIVATPPCVTAGILDEVGRSGTGAVIFDICSLKTPIRGSLESLRERGARACSIHPMFGPATDLLSGRRVVICSLGDDESVQVARSFFADTCAIMVKMGLEDHDRLVSHVLGLSHAVSILFNDVLARSGHNLEALHQLSSTTFEGQLRVAGTLASENPDLYYDIQALNPYTPHMLASIETALSRIRRHVEGKDRQGIVDMMDAARRFYETGARVLGERRERGAGP